MSSVALESIAACRMGDLDGELSDALSAAEKRVVQISARNVVENSGLS